MKQHEVSHNIVPQHSKLLRPNKWDRNAQNLSLYAEQESSTKMGGLDVHTEFQDTVMEGAFLQRETQET